MSHIQGRPTAAGATRRPPAGTATRPARPTAPTRARHARTWARRVPTPERHGPIRAPGPAQAGAAAPPPARPRPARRRARPPAPAIRPAPLPRPRAGAVTVAPPPRLPRPRRAWATRTAATWTRPRRPRRPPRLRPRARRRPAASPYPAGQQPANGNSYPGYTTGPTAAYSDPYGPGHGSVPGGYPANGQPPAADARAEQGTTWYSAPPGGAAGTGGCLPVPGPRVPRRGGLPEPGWLSRHPRNQG